MPILTPDPSGHAVLLHIKAVPGAKRNEIVGPLADRLKVRVAQPPEAGKANAAIITLIADALSLRPANIELTAGHTAPTKTLRITGVSLQDAAARLSITP